MAKEQELTYDEELRDVLITISVIAKRLADRLDQNRKTEEQENGKIEGNLDCP